MVGAATQPNIFQISSLVSRQKALGKISLPVDSSVLLYSRYKHVRGMSPVGSVDGVSLSKLRALDNLIERLIALRGNQPIVRNIGDLTEPEISGLIESYRKGVHSAIISQTSPAVGEDTAISLNIVA